MQTPSSPCSNSPSAYICTVQSLNNAILFGSIGMDHAISKSCYKGAILQRNYREMTISWSFPDNSFVKFHCKKLGSHNMMGVKSKFVSCADPENSVRGGLVF